MYRVIMANTLPELENEVNRALQDGADLIGGVGCITVTGQHYVWFQAVMSWQ